MVSFSIPTVVTCGLVIGVMLGLTGGGGSILTVPLLVYIVGLDAKVAFFVNRGSSYCVACCRRPNSTSWAARSIA